jgi:hypothetical protein
VLRQSCRAAWKLYLCVSSGYKCDIEVCDPDNVCPGTAFSRAVRGWMSPCCGKTDRPDENVTAVFGGRPLSKQKGLTAKAASPIFLRVLKSVFHVVVVP